MLQPQNIFKMKREVTQMGTCANPTNSISLQNTHRKLTPFVDHWKQRFKAYHINYKDCRNNRMITSYQNCRGFTKALLQNNRTPLSKPRNSGKPNSTINSNFKNYLYHV